MEGSELLRVCRQAGVRGQGSEETPRVCNQIRPGEEWGSGLAHRLSQSVCSITRQSEVVLCESLCLEVIPSSVSETPCVRVAIREFVFPVSLLSTTH